MKRIIIVHWNKSTGPEPIIQYPPEKSFPPNDLFLKIWARHELNKGEAIIEFTSEEDSFHYISIVQKFEGEIYFLILAYSNTKKIENIFLDTDILTSIGKNLVELINTNKITRVISEAFNAIKDYKTDKEENLLNFFKDNEEITTPQFKELTNTTRKYTIPLLEYLDATRFSIRVGDVRRLRQKTKST